MKLEDDLVRFQRASSQSALVSQVEEAFATCIVAPNFEQEHFDQLTELLAQISTQFEQPSEGLRTLEAQMLSAIGVVRIFALASKGSRQLTTCCMP